MAKEREGTCYVCLQSDLSAIQDDLTDVERAFKDLLDHLGVYSAAIPETDGWDDGSLHGTTNAIRNRVRGLARKIKASEPVEKIG